MLITQTRMSLITTLSIKDQHKKKYSAMRNWLSQKQLSMGDYIINKWDNEFEVNLEEVLTKSS